MRLALFALLQSSSLILRVNSNPVFPSDYFPGPGGPREISFHRPRSKEPEVSSIANLEASILASETPSLNVRATIPSSFPSLTTSSIRQTSLATSTVKSSPVPTLTSISSRATTVANTSNSSMKSPISSLKPTSTSNRQATASSFKSALQSALPTTATTFNPTPSPYPSKRGIPYKSPATYIQHFNATGSKITWAYNWDSVMDSNFPTYLEFVPMLWGNATSHTTNWKKNVQKAIARGAKAVLGFNEPDACGWGQSCLSPKDAVRDWRKYIEPFAGIVRLGAPAVTEVGTAWLMQFLALCDNCTIDFVPKHIYNVATNVAYFRNHMKDIATKTGRPIWLTEFSVTGNQTAFLQTLMPWMDAQPFIERYSWFMCSPSNAGSTCGTDGYPTTLGEVYELF